MYEDIKDQLIGYKKDSNERIDVYVKDELLSLVFKGVPRSLVHICVLEDDKEHRFLDKIGIGSTMQELKDIAGPYYEEDDVFLLKNYPGIGFESGDREEWADDYYNQKEAPIICISVFDPKD